MCGSTLYVGLTRAVPAESISGAHDKSSFLAIYLIIIIIIIIFIIIINFFSQSLPKRSLHHLENILPEICAFVIGFSCTMWTKMRYLAGSLVAGVLVEAILIFPCPPIPPTNIIGERAKRARHSQVCSIENRVYIYIVRAIRANFVLITRKEGGA